MSRIVGIAAFIIFVIFASVYLGNKAIDSVQKSVTSYTAATDIN